MNILDAEDLIKGLPDDALTQEAQAPSGQVPQFLVVSEIQRRTDMRKRYENDQQQNQGTVAEQIVQEGIAGMMPQQPMGMPPQGMPQGMPPQGMPPQMPQGMPPMGMAQGGIVRMAGGGMPGAYGLYGLQKEYIDPLLDRAKILAQTARVSVEEAYEVLKREAAMNMPNYGMLAPSGNDIPGVMSDMSDAVGRGIQSAYDRIPQSSPDGGMVGRGMDEAGGLIDRGMDAIGRAMPERRSQAEMAEMFSSDEIANRLANRPSLADDLDMTPMDFFNQRVLGQGPDLGIGPEGPVSNPFGVVNSKNPQTQATEDMTVQGSSDRLEVGPRGPVSNPFGTKNPGTEPVPSPISELLDAAVDLTTDASDPRGRPGLDISDILGESRNMTQANMLMQLGAGIAGGDLSKGISAAGAVGMKGAQDRQALDIRKRLAEYQAGREDDARGDAAVLAREKIDAELSRSEGTTQRELIRFYSDQADGLRKKATTLASMGGSLTEEDLATLQAITDMISEYSSEFGLGLPTIKAPSNDPLNFGDSTLGRLTSGM